MNGKTLILAGIMGAGALFLDSSVHSSEYILEDNRFIERDKAFYEQRIKRTSDIEVVLKTITSVTKGEDQTNYTSEGSGFVVGHYLFSRDHVTSKYSLGTMRTAFGVVNLELDRDTMDNETTFLDGLALHSVYESREDDVAIFDLSKQDELCKRYCNDLTLDDLMKESELYIGMRVHWVGRPQGRDGYYRESHVTKLREEEKKGTIYQDTFVLNDPLIPGTSGKPIWGEDRIVGVAHYRWGGLAGLGFMDNYIREIERYENP